MNLNLAFSPELPVFLIIAIAVIIGAFVIWGLMQRLRGSFVRLLAWGLMVFALFNPAILNEDRELLKSVVAVVVDKSASQTLDGREQQTESVLASVRERFSNLDEFELREIVATDQISSTTDVSTALFKALQSSLQDVPAEQLAGAVLVTDGQVHDIPKDLSAIGIDAPVHALITGKENEKDRRIKIENAPRFGVVGEQQEITFRVQQMGFENPNELVDVTVLFDGVEQSVEQVEAGTKGSYSFDVPHGGKNIIELRVNTAPNEITDVNNKAFVTLNGIRENLRVLLVSGEPHAGERTWRNLLKSDASVDLVHFTILRPPEKQDGTPISQLSLIAFPTRELFIQKIDEFDLIILDRYQRRGVLPILYFDNIARYVRDGGALMVAAGPEFAGVGSVGNTPLNTILPGLATGDVSEEAFKPKISEEGLKHPVARGLDGWDEEDPKWSRWFRSVGVEPLDGETVLARDNKDPLLMLNRAGEGRVALFLSDHVWLWARGFEGGGPYVQLLRRIAHWLMKEPELDEERLTAKSRGKTITISRQTLGETPADATITGGKNGPLTAKFIETKPGLFEAEIEVETIGLYEVTNGDMRALTHVGPPNPREFTDVLSSTKLLEPVLAKTNGATLRVEDGQSPRIIAVRKGATTSGNGWIGLTNNQASVLKGVDRIPLFSGLLGLTLLLFALSSMWFREGR